MSTFCRKCSKHFNITDGKAVSTKKDAYNPFARRSPQKKMGASAQSEAEVQIRLTKKPATPAKVAPTFQVGPRTQTPQVPASFPKREPVSKPRRTSLFKKSKAEPRQIRCFDCKAEHQTSPNSTSTLCPKCGTYISLKNYDIRENWNRRIQTRGDVFISKKGVVTGTTIQSHHLTVEGDFTGSVECSGDLIIRRHGEIMGKVICRRLIIEKRATVKFFNSVETDECTIDGLVTGTIVCKGRLSLEKKSVLTGNIKVGRLAIAEGAKHQGQIQMGG